MWFCAHIIAGQWVWREIAHCNSVRAHIPGNVNVRAARGDQPWSGWKIDCAPVCSCVCVPLSFAIYWLVWFPNRSPNESCGRSGATVMQESFCFCFAVFSRNIIIRQLWDRACADHRGTRDNVIFDVGFNPPSCENYYMHKFLPTFDHPRRASISDSLDVI